ncbi:MAG: hypothetical protein JNL01_12930 [Bdellovibrionales bacterium]|nr:hypothetical protein [Bdellovibrionales bacterium]
MKIQVVPQLNIPGGTVRNKRNEGNGGNGQNAYENQFGRKDQESSAEDSKDQAQKRPPEGTLAAVGSSESFSDVLDAAYPENDSYSEDIAAELGGRGPGLRVKVKDGGKAIVRQLSGDDFLALRQVTRRAK